MKVALLADIHGNRQALEAVLADARARGAEEYWVLGDIIGYGPDPNGTVELLSALPARVITGNCCRRLREFYHNPAASPAPRTLIKRLLFRWTLEAISPWALGWLGAQPTQLDFELDGRRVTLCHARPGDDEKGILAATPAEELAAIAAAGGAHLLCCGHSHRALDRTVGGCRFINPGPLGRPEDGDPRAYYALLDTAAADLAVEFRRVRYDWDATFEAVLAAGLPLAVARMYVNGLRLKDVLAGPPPEFPDVLEDPLVVAAQRFNVRRNFNPGHEHQVTHVCSNLFDALWHEHGLGREEKVLLCCAAHLHDAGWVDGKKGHHKASRDIILADRSLGFTDAQRRMAALLARYHRGAMPSRRKHPHYARMGLMDRWKIRMLAGILRIADGIDHSHMADVDAIECQSDDDSVVVGISGACRTSVMSGVLAAQRKSDLLSRALRKRVLIVLLDGAGPLHPSHPPPYLLQPAPDDEDDAL